MELGTLDAPTTQKVVAVASRMRLISLGLLEASNLCSDVQDDFAQHARRILQREVFPPATRPDQADTRPDPLDDSAVFAPYRRWFLANFANPYPSSKDKDALLAQVPRHNKTQLDTWFTNNRRRSGWQALKRAHAAGAGQSGADEMARLMRDVDAGRADDEVHRQVKRVRAFFDEGSRDKVSDEIQAIVRHGVTVPAVPSATQVSRRRIEQRAARGVGGQAATATEMGGPRTKGAAPSGLSAGRSRRSYTPPRQTRYAMSPSDMSPLARDDEPRFPSTFSSPMSMRTVSDSSSASLDSLVSYASTESMYYDAPVASSPPATSSLLSFDGARRTSSSRLPYPPLPSPPLFRPHAGRAAPYPASRPHPYFCTVEELPTSSLAGFAAPARG